MVAVRTDEGALPEAWTSLVEVFDVGAVQYTLNLDTLPDTVPDDAPRRAAFDVLTGIAARARSTPAGLDRQLVIGDLLTYQPDSRTTLAAGLHVACGGTCPVVANDDLDGLFAWLCADYFVDALLPSGDGPVPLRLAASVFSHWAANRLAAALMADPDFAALFPAGEAGSSDLIWSTGVGGGLQVSMAAHSLLHYTYAAMRADGALDVNRVREYAARTIATARSLARRQVTQVPLVAAVTNIGLAAGAEGGDLGIATLRPRNASERVIPNRVADGTVTLCVPTDLQLLHVGRYDATPDGAADAERTRLWQHFGERLSASYRARQRELDRARLALLFTSDGAVVAPRVVAWAVLNPLAGGAFNWHGPIEGISPLPHVDLTPERVAVAAGWYRRVQQHPESLWLGARRLLSATERSDPLDGFVDAVIAWENMLGTTEGETTFRVCGGLAILLEPVNLASRKALFDELRDLYTARSKLVHGGREPKRPEASRHRDRAIAVALNAMRAVYDRPDLLGASSSSERNRVLLLGA